MTVYFIGAGPGAADLITVRGQRLLQSCPVCLYAGSIMPDDVLAYCPPGAKIALTVSWAGVAAGVCCARTVAAKRTTVSKCLNLHSGERQKPEV